MSEHHNPTAEPAESGAADSSGQSTGAAAPEAETDTVNAPAAAHADTTTPSDTEPATPSLTSFADLGLEDSILRALDEVGYAEPMEVQVEVIPVVLAGTDVLVQSRTGTGKTAAFLLPIIAGIDSESKGAQALILAPTRELALQVANEGKRLSQFKGVEIVPIYGGAPIKPQIQALERGAQVIAGTPGRVLDHIRRKTLRTDQIRYMVLDECDEMLSMGFLEEIEAILGQLPPKEKRINMLFSATIPDDAQRIAKRHMKEWKEIALSSDAGISVEMIDHYFYVVSGMARTRDLLKVIIAEEPESAIIFCNTREDTNLVARYLAKHGYNAVAISSDLSQRERERVMKRMRAGEIRFLCATDVAARGIDISGLSHVINYTFPESPQVYVHRTGRTGRAGERGIAISLVGPREIGNFYYLKLTYKIRPEERDLPSSEELNALQETQRYEQIVSMVSEEPRPEYLSLARRVWQSEQGERVMAALLQRLFDRQLELARRQERQDTEERRARVESDRAERDSERGERDGRRRRRRDRDRDRDRDGERDGRRRRRRDRDDEPRDGAANAETGPHEAADDEARDEGGRRKRRRRRRGDGDEGRRERSSASNASNASNGETKEFWETWADEKTGESDADSGDDMVRLYVNIGKREKVDADQVRGLLSEGMAPDDADKIGSIAVRNTHTYVRVPEDLVDKVIAASEGKVLGERDVVVERAKR